MKKVITFMILAGGLAIANRAHAQTGQNRDVDHSKVNDSRGVPDKETRAPREAPAPRETPSPRETQGPHETNNGGSRNVEGNQVRDVDHSKVNDNSRKDRQR